MCVGPWRFFGEISSGLRLMRHREGKFQLDVTKRVFVIQPSRIEMWVIVMCEWVVFWLAFVFRVDDKLSQTNCWSFSWCMFKVLLMHFFGCKSSRNNKNKSKIVIRFCCVEKFDLYYLLLNEMSCGKNIANSILNSSYTKVWTLF